MTTIVIVTAHLSPVERIPNKLTKIFHFLMRIRVQPFSLMRIRIRPFTLIRIRILLLIKVKQIGDHWHTDPPRLHCVRPRPSVAPF